MKPFIRNPAGNASKKHNDDKDKHGAAEGAKKAEKLVTNTEQNIIVNDRDLDYRLMENVEKILTKYRNSHTNRRNFDRPEQLDVENLMLEAQKGNPNVLIEIKMVQISTYFASAKLNLEGYFKREDWLLVNGLITEFIEMLKSKKFDLKKQQAVAASPDKVVKDEGGDIDAFNQSSEAQILPALVNFVDKLD